MSFLVVAKIGVLNFAKGERKEKNPKLGAFCGPLAEVGQLQNEGDAILGQKNLLKPYRRF